MKTEIMKIACITCFKLFRWNRSHRSRIDKIIFSPLKPIAINSLIFSEILFLYLFNLSFFPEIIFFSFFKFIFFSVLRYFCFFKSTQEPSLLEDGEHPVRHAVSVLTLIFNPRIVLPVRNILSQTIMVQPIVNVCQDIN